MSYWWQMAYVGLLDQESWTRWLDRWGVAISPAGLSSWVEILRQCAGNDSYYHKNITKHHALPMYAHTLWLYIYIFECYHRVMCVYSILISEQYNSHLKPHVQSCDLQTDGLSYLKHCDLSSYMALCTQEYYLIFDHSSISMLWPLNPVSADT